jgi:Leucine-rich repeat (LRR) protein
MINPQNEPGISSFTTTLPVTVLCRPQGMPGADWQEFDRGPGVIQLPPGMEGSLRTRNIDDEQLACLVSEIAGCEAVTELNLSENRSVSNDGLAYLKKLPQLTSLNLSSCGLSNEGLSFLAGLTLLERLDLSYCNRITDVGLKFLWVLRNLVYLNLQGCVKASNGGISKLRRGGLTIHK